MRVFLVMLSVGLASSYWANAQVEVELVLGQDQYLRDESMPVAVRISNRSGQALRLGTTRDWLTFTVESLDGFLIAKRSEPEAGGGFKLGSSEVVTKQVELMPYFDLSQPGRYRVSVGMRIEDWEKVIESEPAKFDIGRGVTLWEETFGVPAAGGAPEVRKYALQQANYVSRPTLYLRLTNPMETAVFRVFPLGPLVSFSRPEHELDRGSRLHVLFQTGARSFNYSVVDPQGRLVGRQTHHYFGTRPVLKRDGGEVLVKGGVRRASADDIPGVVKEESAEDVRSGTH